MTVIGSENMVELRAGDLRLVLRPDLGGAVAGLWLGDTAVLRDADPAALGSARAAGCFPLVPYSNRLGYCRFAWKGRQYTTAPNFGDEPHSVHGVGWQRAWSVEEAGADSALMECVNPSDADWPFAIQASQKVELTPTALTLTLTATNIDARNAPVGLGWHPYFPKRSRSRMHLELSDRWDTDGARLPVRKVAQAAGIDADVANLEYDNCFEGWSGAARLRDEKLSMRLTSSLGRVVIYTPRDRPYYCVEPVSHVSNAIHMADPIAHGLQSLEPGASMTAWMKLEIARA